MRLVFATNNAHKLEEGRQILGDRFEVLSLSDINCHEDIPETGDTFQDNALQKARYVKEHYGYDCFADDTGLEVKALGGAPGVHSARYAGDHDSEANMTKLLQELEKKQDRSAQFRTVVALILNGQEVLFEGIVTGRIATERHYGESGFGYDPLFIPDGFTETFSQMSPENKNQVSHRGRAVRKLADYLKTL
jgi:XTP/dITP diphosphohydrolase